MDVRGVGDGVSERIPVGPRVAHEHTAVPTIQLPFRVARASQGLVAHLEAHAHVRRHRRGLLRRDAEELVVELRDFGCLEHRAVASHRKADRVLLPVVNIDIPPRRGNEDLCVRAGGEHRPIRQRLEAVPRVPGHDGHHIVAAAARLRRPIDVAQGLLCLPEPARDVEHPRLEAEVLALGPVRIGEAQMVAAEDHELVFGQGDCDHVIIIRLGRRHQGELAAFVLHQVHHAQLLGIDESYVVLQLRSIVVAQGFSPQLLLVVRDVEAGAHEGVGAPPCKEGVLILEPRSVGGQQGRCVDEVLIRPLVRMQINHVHVRGQVLQRICPHARSSAVVLEPRRLPLCGLLPQVLVLEIFPDGAPFQHLLAILHDFRGGFLALEQLHHTEALVGDLHGEVGGKLLQSLGGRPSWVRRA
mmetsp:Transcript_86439/g.249396  ORF Transcript_86439/g.249396 Transcript_86439/m.249396 type:complete len:413 (+) Transcript_86439:928-2166(+)